MLSKWKSRFGLFAVLAMIATFLVVIPAAANAGSGTGVGTGATVGSGNGWAPQIVCKWELPDAKPNTPGMQYGQDDSSDNPGYPCRGIDGVGDGTIYVPDLTVIQVKANAEDSPSERYIELWTAVRGIQSVSDVSAVIWDVYHPDNPKTEALNRLKWQTHGERVTAPTARELGLLLGSTFNSTSGQYDLTQYGMWWAASTMTKQIDPATATSQNGIIARAAQNGVLLYKSSFELSKHQPCGEYRVRERATFMGQTTEVNNYIQVLCFAQLEADFDTVEWGDVTPGAVDYVYGDLTFDPTKPQFPTVKNTGSGAMELKIEFSPMRAIGDTDPGSDKIITEFDGAFANNPDGLQAPTKIMANDRFTFGKQYFQVLCANEVGKLDLSIHPPVDKLPAGRYVGTLTLWGQWTESPSTSGTAESTSPCLNEQGVYNPPAVRDPFVQIIAVE